MFQRRLERARSNRGGAEDACHDARRSRCWRSSQRPRRARTGHGRVSRAADHAGGAVRAERRQRHHGASRRRAHGQGARTARSWSRTGRAPRQYRLAPGRAQRARRLHDDDSGSTGTIGINPSLYANLGYDPAKDLTPIGFIATSPAVLVVHPSLPVKTLKELIAYAKANPGQLQLLRRRAWAPWSTSRPRDVRGAPDHGGAGSDKGTGPGSPLARRTRQDDDAADPRHDRYVIAGTLRAIGVTSKERSAAAARRAHHRGSGRPARLRVGGQRYGPVEPAGTPRG